MLTKAYIPYKGYYSSPFSRWQGSMANENSIVLAAETAKRWLAEKNWDPKIYDYLFLGKEYELIFDRFEILLALANAIVRKEQNYHIWGPVGRFGWKFKSNIRRDNPLKDIIQEVKDQENEWPPFKAKLFGADFQLLMDATDDYARLISKLGYY